MTVREVKHRHPPVLAARHQMPPARLDVKADRLVGVRGAALDAVHGALRVAHVPAQDMVVLARPCAYDEPRGWKQSGDSDWVWVRVRVRVTCVEMGLGLPV